MFELLEAAVAPPNLLYTILLALMLLYWVLVLIGGISSETFEFFGMEVGTDADSDVDVDASADIDDPGLEAGHGSPLGSVLHFFYIGDIPLMIILSILILSMWTMSMVVNHLLGNVAGWVALLLFPPLLVAGLAATRTVLMPFVPYLKKVLAQKGDRIELVGKRCVIRSLEATATHGQAEVAAAGAPLVLNVVTRRGIVLPQGAEAVVCDYDKISGAYLVAPFDQDQARATAVENSS